MLDQTQEEPKKCSCPYCPGHGWQRVKASQIDAAGSEPEQLSLRQMTFDFYLSEPEPTE